MRKILFRAKAINRDPDGNYRTSYQNGDWVYGLLTALPDEHFGFPAKMRNVAGISGIEVDYKTLGQFTGLTDKNGVKIFEGDIIQNDDPDEEPAKVFYDEEETEFAVIIDNGYYGLGSNFNETDLTVIGNIHDNPELLWDGGSE